VLVRDFLEQSADRLPEKTALICDGKRLSYREVDEAADKVARTLKAIGVKRGDRVAIFLPNSVETVVAIFGILKASATFVAINATTKREKFVEQGEGATGDWAAAHYGRFLGVLEDYLAMRKSDPGFEPAHPVVAAGMRGVEGIEPVVYVTDPATGGCSDLFNAVYELVLQMIARYFAFGHETSVQRQVLAHAAVGLMFQAIKPLGLLLARLPVGPDHRGVTAGANFQLPYRASFLLPHRRSAWLRFAERLDELAVFAAGLHPPEAEDVVAAVSAALGRMALDLTAHVEVV